VSRTALLWVNSPEPCQVLINLALGPQSLLEDKPQVPRKVSRGEGGTQGQEGRCRGGCMLQHLLQDVCAGHATSWQPCPGCFAAHHATMYMLHFMYCI
jgi:hypothetical protein